MAANSSAEAPMSYVCGVLVNGVPCQASYSNPASLGTHKSMLHGIRGTSRATLDKIKKAAREAAEKKVQESDLRKGKGSVPPEDRKSPATVATDDIKPNSKKMYSCPECGKTYKKANALGRHRQAAHGIPGSSPSNMAQRKRQGKLLSQVMGATAGQPATQTAILTRSVPLRNGKYHCPECSRGFDDRSGLGKHRRFAHNILGEFRKQVVERAASTHQDSGLAIHHPQTMPAVPEAEVNGSIHIHGEINYGSNPSSDSHEKVPIEALSRGFTICDIHLTTLAKVYRCTYAELALAVARLLQAEAGG